MVANAAGDGSVYNGCGEGDGTYADVGSRHLHRAEVKSSTPLIRILGQWWLSLDVESQDNASSA
jgi:hypothetical protein